MTPEQQKLITEVKEWCCRHENYEHGWDIVVECLNDEEILEFMGNAKTLKGALRNIDKEYGVKLHYERRLEIEGTIF